jgi:hypothetical protein
MTDLHTPSPLHIPGRLDATMLDILARPYSGYGRDVRIDPKLPARCALAVTRIGRLLPEVSDFVISRAGAPGGPIAIVVTTGRGLILWRARRAADRAGVRGWRRRYLLARMVRIMARGIRAYDAITDYDKSGVPTIVINAVAASTDTRNVGGLLAHQLTLATLLNRTWRHDRELDAVLAPVDGDAALVRDELFDGLQDAEYALAEAVEAAWARRERITARSRCDELLGRLNAFSWGLLYQAEPEWDTDQDQDAESEYGEDQDGAELAGGAR